MNERKEKEEKKQTAAKSDTNIEPKHSVGKTRRLKTKTKEQTQNLTDIRKHFDRGHTKMKIEISNLIFNFSTILDIML